MASNVDIASGALVLCGADTIASFDEDSQTAQIVSTLYQPFVEAELSAYPWTFATKKRQLSQETGTPTNEYTYQHIVPAEALLVWAVFDSSNIGATPVRDYDMYGSASGRRIFSNYDELYADYTFYTDEGNWHPTFVEFITHAFASRIAMPLTRSQQLADMHRMTAYGSLQGNQKGGLLGRAMATDSKQKRNEYLFSNPIVDARFS